MYRHERVNVLFNQFESLLNKSSLIQYSNTVDYIVN